jgi:hypothetical protein
MRSVDPDWGACYEDGTPRRRGSSLWCKTVLVCSRVDHLTFDGAGRSAGHDRSVSNMWMGGGGVRRMCTLGP